MWNYFLPLWERFETTILTLRLKKNLGLKIYPDCVTKALFSNNSNVTFLQKLVIYLFTNMHCYY